MKKAIKKLNRMIFGKNKVNNFSTKNYLYGQHVSANLTWGSYSHMI